MKVVWTEQAWRRLSEIEEFVARDRPAAAAKLVDKLIDRGDGRFEGHRLLRPEELRGSE